MYNNTFVYFFWIFVSAFFWHCFNSVVFVLAYFLLFFLDYFFFFLPSFFRRIFFVAACSELAFQMVGKPCNFFIPFSSSSSVSSIENLMFSSFQVQYLQFLLLWRNACEMGFESTSQGGDLFFWDLINSQDGQSRLLDLKFVRYHI